MSSAVPMGPRPSRVDELLTAIDAALEGLRSAKGLRGHYPKAYAELEARNEAARTVALAASYEALTTGYPRTAQRVTRRPVDDAIAYAVLDALYVAYRVP